MISLRTSWVASTPKEAKPEAPTGPTAEVLADHLNAFGKQDVDAIMSDYTDESVMISNIGVFKGTAEIRKVFEGMVAEFIRPDTQFNMGKTFVDGEIALITWDAKTSVNEYKFAADALVVREGKIVAQTVALHRTPRSSR